jgi:hypothetical protein
MFKRIKLLLALNKAAGQYDELSKEIDSMDTKHLLLSKTFWLNIAGLAVTISGVLPDKYAIPVLAVANIVNRIFTVGAVNILPLK